MNLNEIYTEVITEHNLSKHNRRKFENPDAAELAHNPSCGDEISLELKFDGDVISDAAFSGEGCAISQASTSIMIDLLKGKNKKEALELIELYLNMITRKEVRDDILEDRLGEAYVLKNISNMPGRVKCAVLSWHTLKDILNDNKYFNA